MHDDDDERDTLNPSRGISAAPTERCEECGAIDWVPLDESHYLCNKCKKTVREVKGRRV